MSKSDKEFREALVGKKIPILTLDNQWHQLIGSVEPDKELAARYEERYRKFAQIYPTVKALFPVIS